MLGVQLLDQYFPNQTLSSAKAWHSLRLLNYYRITLACVFIFLFLVSNNPSILGRTSPVIYYTVSLSYLVFGLISTYSIHLRRPSVQIQINVQTIVDITTLTLLMHVGGGLSSGLGVLLVIAVAFSSLVASGRQAILYASFATIAVLTEATYTYWSSEHTHTTWSHAGLLGIAFFVTSFLFAILAHRLSESEARIKQQDLDLANLEQLNDYVIQNLNSGIIVVDDKNIPHLTNESAWFLLGNKGIAKKLPLARLSEELLRQLELWRKDPSMTPEKFKAGQDTPHILPRFARLGSEGNAGTVIFLEDQTEVTQHIQQMKLASLGRLTASIAHEIRNPLGAISHAAQLLEESPALSKEDIRLTEIIHKQSQRMNTIIENVLQLSKPHTSHSEDLLLVDWLQEFKRDFCLSAKIERNQIKINITPTDTLINFDPNHLQQLLWNLCQNSILHSGKTNSSKILIQLTGGCEDDKQAPYLDIIDNGPGIEKDLLSNIFEPFFTTSGNGTGLGLYITRELCERNKARLNCLSIKTGARFRISFHDAMRLPL